MITGQTRIVGNGSRYISGTTEVTGLSHTTIEADEDTTFDSITGVDNDGNVVNILTTMNLTGVTLKDGRAVYCSLDYKITAVKLATGSIYVH